MSVEKGQLRAILVGAVRICARMWARGTVVTGLCPACGHENEDLTHLWWNCKAEQYAHYGESTSAHERGSHAPGIQRYDVGSEGHTAPGLGKNQQDQRSDVAAAEKLRSRVGDVRDKDDGSKMSAAKAAEELGGYLCEGRLQVWTDGSGLDPQWEAITRAGAGVYFSKDGNFHMHFSIKARRGQTSVRGELEAATCAILALDMPTRIHTDCEWAKKGIK